jgi:cell volume regulation protein A
MDEPLSIAILLAAVGALLIVAVVASPLSQRLGVPVLAIFLALGMAAGSEGVGGIPFDDYALAFQLGAIALVLILFDGGLNTPAPVFRRVVWPAALLATIGVVLTASIMAGIGILLGLPAPIAVLIGSVVSSTDAAAVFSVLRGSGVRLKENTGAVLEVESGLNDPMAMLLTVLATEAVLAAHPLGWETAQFVAAQFAFGVAGGLLLGWGGRALLRRVRLPAAGLYPVLTVGLAFAAFGVPTVLEGSGFLAVYLAAMLLASGSLPYRGGVRRVHDALAWLAQIIMFVLLGLLVFPSRLVPMLPGGFILALALAFVARPVAVLLTLWPFHFTWRERLFIAWVGLRGAVPIILATYPVVRGVVDGDGIFHLVFFVVVVNTLLPGATVAWLARRFGVAQPLTSAPPASVELISLRDYPNEFVWYTVHHVSAVAGALVRDLPLPPGCVLTLLLRGDEVIGPRGDTQFAPGDHVCVFVSPGDRPLLDLLFGRAESEGGQ